MVNQDKINIIIADDSPEFIKGLCLLISKRNDFRILDTCINGLELLNNKNIEKADLLLVDIDMPIMNGHEAAIRINYARNELPMIALSMHKENIYLDEIICSGFKGFIHKPDVATKFFEVIGLVLDKKYVFPKNLTL